MSRRKNLRIRLTHYRRPTEFRHDQPSGYNHRMREKPKRRWFRFSLRTLLVVVFVASLPLTWVGYSLIWIRERNAFLFPSELHGISPFGTSWDGVAPLSLRIFGEHGISTVYVPQGMDDAVAKRAAALFPEATITRSGLSP